MWKMSLVFLYTSKLDSFIAKARMVCDNKKQQLVKFITNIFTGILRPTFNFVNLCFCIISLALTDTYDQV